MGIWASLFSSPSVIKKAADGIYNGVDVAIYTDQEKAAGFMDIIDDPRLDTVNFNLQSTKDVIDYLVSIEVLTVERAVQVKTGVFL
jgi:hypothetical protein